MNERIKQLAEQAGLVKEFAISGLWLADDEELEHFAELIWKEAHEQGYDKGMSDCFDGQGGV